MPPVIDTGAPPRRKPNPMLPPLLGGGGLMPSAGGAPGMAPGTAPYTVDVNNDPILQAIRALTQRQVQEATDAELSGRKQSLIDFGYDPALNDVYPDSGTAGAAQANPFSVLANLLYAHQQGSHDIDEEMNRANLFYSSTRAKNLAKEQRGYEQQKASGLGALRQNLSGLGEALLAAKNSASAQNTTGLSDAYSRFKPSEVSAPTPTSTPAAASGGDGGQFHVTPPVYTGPSYVNPNLLDGTTNYTGQVNPAVANGAYNSPPPIGNVPPSIANTPGIGSVPQSVANQPTPLNAALLQALARRAAGRGQVL